MANTIVRSGCPPKKEAAVTNAAVTPGHLLARTATGVRPHNTADAVHQKAFAVERDYMGDETLDTAFAVGEICPFVLAQPGDEIYAFLDNGESVAIGAFLTSAGNGNLQAPGTPVPGSYVAVALETVDASGGTSRIKVEVL